MKTTGKIICLILSAVIFLYLVLWDYPHYRARLSTEAISMEREDISDISEESGDNSGEGKSQEKEQNDRRSETKEQQAETKSRIYLYFDQVFESCYDQLYPLMKEMGYTGTMVLTDGQLPGDYLQMTEEQCKEMLNDGWELAVGGSESIDLTQDLANVESEWRTYLEDYLAEIKLRLNIIPTVYCFNEGEYREEYDGILKEYGFETIRYFGDEDLQDKEDGLTRIRAYRIVQDTEIDQAAEDLKDYTAAALCTRRVASEIQAGSENMEITKYKELLEKINEEESLYIAGNTRESENQH